MHYSDLLPLIFLPAVALAQKVAVDGKVLGALTRYAYFSSAAYSLNCKIPPFGSSVETKFQDSETDAQGTLFRDDAMKEYILAWRGTSSISDILVDLQQSLVDCTPVTGANCPNCTCHEGFLSQWRSVKDDVTSYISSSLASRPNYRLIITGHSLGGSLASFTGTYFRTQGRELAVYTYGQPRTGNQAYADFVDDMFTSAPGSGNVSTMARATNDNDGIPQVPGKRQGYRHHSTEFWISPKDVGVFQCTGQEPTGCNQRKRGMPLNAAHFSYFGTSIADPMHKDVACDGKYGTLANGRPYPRLR